MHNYTDAGILIIIMKEESRQRDPPAAALLQLDRSDQSAHVSFQQQTTNVAAPSHLYESL